MLTTGWHCRTFDVAKTIMKDKLFVHNKSDNIIDLPKDKIQAVSISTLFP
jgi:hypothetical protein